MKLGKLARTWWRRRAFERDLAEEVRIHCEMSGAAAFGSEALALEQSREVWGLAWLDSWQQDIRYALRGLRKSPAFTLGVIGAIALGIGLNTTVFTVFNAYVLRPHAVRDPYTLYQVEWSGRDFTASEVAELPLREAFGYHNTGALLEGRPAMGQVVTGNYFTILGAAIAEGRPLLPDDRGGVMVLSFDAWRNKFGGAPGMIGRTLHLRGDPYEVVGIAAPRFTGIEAVPLAFWIPVSPDAHDLRVIGRVDPGGGARERLKAWAQARSPGRVQIIFRSAATMIPLRDGDLLAFLPLVIAFGLVLAIACANVSNMMLARALARRREIAIRVSLGAGRARLIRQLLTESILLAVPAAAAGFAISQATLMGTTRLLLATLPAAVARILAIADLTPDWRIFAFILAASVFTTLLFGLAPAVQTTRGDFRVSRPARLRSILVIGQVTVCALLSISTAVLLRSERRVAQQRPGLDTRGVWDVRLATRFQEKAASVLAAEPGVQSVAAVWNPPLYNPMSQLPMTTSGSTEVRFPGYNFVSSEYFSLLRIPVLSGRAFTEAESEAEGPVAVVSALAARRLWPGGGAVGQTIAIQDGYRTVRLPAWRSARVIGVVGDVAGAFSGVNGPETCVYFPTNGRAARNPSLLVRIGGDPVAARRILDTALEKVAPSAADLILPMDDVMALQSYPFRVTWWVAAFLGGVALLMTVSGIYGVMSYVVGQRTHEIGIRVALGAARRDVVWMMLRQSGGLAAIGLAVGVGLALAVAPVFAHVVTALDPFDAVAYTASTAVILAAALAASYGPARRAMGIDPAVTLRGE